MLMKIISLPWQQIRVCRQTDASHLLYFIQVPLSEINMCVHMKCTETEGWSFIHLLWDWGELDILINFTPLIIISNPPCSKCPHVFLCVYVLPELQRCPDMYWYWPTTDARRVGSIFLMYPHVHVLLVCLWYIGPQRCLIWMRWNYFQNFLPQNI